MKTYSTIDENALLRQLSKILRPYSQTGFLYRLGKKPNILDVGCGKRACIAKKIRPNSIYTCIDIIDYKNKPPCMDFYIFASPENFKNMIEELNQEYDAVISAHNLEHCNDRYGTLEAMLKVIKVGGKLYLSFPSKKSVDFPKRMGTLNSYDDPTHKDMHPDFFKIKK
ncbi:MAG: methyltransferase domain-containing protein [Candidatus Micrarchaeaceae archaeon]